MPSSRVCGQVKAHPELQTLAEEGGGIFGEEEEYHLGTFFRRAMNLVPDSYLENMLWTQVTLHGLADSLDSIYDLISWKDRASTAFITLGIFVSMFLFLVVPFNLFLMIQGTWYDTPTSTYFSSTSGTILLREFRAARRNSMYCLLERRPVSLEVAHFPWSS